MPSDKEVFDEQVKRILGSEKGTAGAGGGTMSTLSRERFFHMMRKV
jgi:hypothetical protein